MDWDIVRALYVLHMGHLPGPGLWSLVNEGSWEITCMSAKTSCHWSAVNLRPVTALAIILVIPVMNSLSFLLTHMRNYLIIGRWKSVSGWFSWKGRAAGTLFASIHKNFSSIRDRQSDTTTSIFSIWDCLTAAMYSIRDFSFCNRIRKSLQYGLLRPIALCICTQIHLSQNISTQRH